jgi:hypothetical protein
MSAWFALDNYFTDGSLALTASSAATEYPVTNLGLEQLKRWRSTAVAAAEWVRGVGFPNDFQPIVWGHRGHNLQTGATIGLYVGDPAGANSLAASTTAVAGQPFLLAAAIEWDNTSWFVKFTDTTNPAGYLEIPFLFIGLRLTLTKSFRPGSRERQFAEGTVTADGAGGRVVYPNTGQLWSRTLEFQCENAADEAILRQVASRSLTGRPFVFCQNSADLTTSHLCWKDDPLEFEFAHLAARAGLWQSPIHTVPMTLREVGS